MMWGAIGALDIGEVDATDPHLLRELRLCHLAFFTEPFDLHAQVPGRQCNPPDYISQELATTGLMACRGFRGR